MEGSIMITVVLGTARKERASERAARFIVRELEKRENIDVQFVDVKDHLFSRTIPPWEESEATSEWRDIAEETDGFVLVVPEYNRGYPGELKMLLDSELKAYKRKPAMLVGVSSGKTGGARVIEHLQSVLGKLGLVYTHSSVLVPTAKETLDEDGNPTGEMSETLYPAAERAIDALLWFTHALKRAREASD